MKALPMPYSSLPTQYVEHGEYVSEEIDLFTRDQVLAIQKQAYEDGLRDAVLIADRTHSATKGETVFEYGWSLASLSISKSISMLTASKKEPQ